MAHPYLDLHRLTERAKETTVRVVRRSKRSGSKVYVLIGSAEFLVNLIPYFQSNGTASSTKYVLIATDSWNANLTQGKPYLLISYSLK